jgi:menaquinone-9 beta-reductase
MKPITIAGGGLAGLALGVALRQRDVPVTVLEAGSYPRHRVCGEFISGVSNSELEALGISDCLAGSVQLHETAWFDAQGRLLSATLPESARGLSRYDLDQRLADRFCVLGGVLQDGTRLDRDAEGVVWANGRQKQPSKWMGLKAHYAGLTLESDLEVHFGDHAYVGLAKVEDDRVNVCGLFRREQSLPGGEVLVQALHDATLGGLARRLAAASLVPGSLKGVSHFSLGWQTHADDTRARIGDAAVMIPPFTGNGMSMAFQSALLASEPLLAWSAGYVDWPQTVVTLGARHQERFASRLRWARLMQSVLMNRSGRKLAAWLIKRQWMTFDSLYRKVR